MLVGERSVDPRALSRWVVLANESNTRPTHVWKGISGGRNIQGAIVITQARSGNLC